MKYRRKLCLIAAVGTVLSAGFFAYSRTHHVPVEVLNRPQSGAGDRTEELMVEISGKQYPITMTVAALPYEEETVWRELAEAAEGLETVFLNGNESADRILTDVSMPYTYPGTGIAIRWYLDSWDHIEPDGAVRNESLTEPVPVNVQAVLTLRDRTYDWEQRFLVCPLENPDASQKIRVLESEFRDAQSDGTEKEVYLPKSVLGETVRWYQKEDDRWIWIAVLTGITLCAVVLGQRREEEQLLHRHERAMEIAYPEIVSRLGLYMGAGISTRKAWERIVQGYEEKIREKGKKQDAYEEMRTTLHEMQSGVPEALAYERFGTRCRMPAYLKLGTLLSQNLRKGTKNLTGLLTEESKEAFENRKALARKMGEECESKLLLPMLLMLLTVLIMVMYPAIISFQV